MADDPKSRLAAACEGPAFSNGTEGDAWMSKWCEYCEHDHEMHANATGPGCSLIGNHMIDHHSWPEAWLPEPDDGRGFLPSRMVCLAFKACNLPGGIQQEGGCNGDPGADARAERVAEVTAYWNDAR